MANECDSIQIKYSGDGNRVLFPFPFPYMSYDDIVCFLYDEDSDTWENQENKFIFANATTVEFLTAPPAPTELGFENVWITRNTDIERMIATFYPGSSIRAQDLNDDFDQLRLAIQEGRCELERSLNELDENTWNKDEAFTEDDQVNARWVAADDEKVATSDAIIARHDSYVQPNVPPTVTYQQTGKTWQNTEECWTSYWQNSVDGEGNDSETWVAYVNTGPRGEQGPAGPPGQSIVGPPPGLQNPAAIATNVPPKAPGVIGDATADVVQDPDSLDIQFTFGIPEGAAASVDVGTTTTGAPGTEANVTNSGTLNAAILDFISPRGEKGEKGDQGDQGDKGDQGNQGSIGDNPPANPDVGVLWFDTKCPSGQYIWDGNQWVGTSIPGPAGPAGGVTSIIAGTNITIDPPGGTGIVTINATDTAAGEGVPTGGTAGQVLSKIDATDFNTQWVDQTGGPGDGIPEAPNDGELYGRQSQAWAAINIPDPGISEAPNDGQQYVRESEAWEVINIPNPLTFTAPLQKTGDNVSFVWNSLNPLS